MTGNALVLVGRVCGGALMAVAVALWLGFGALGTLAAAAAVFLVGACVTAGCQLWASLDTTTAFPHQGRRTAYYALRGLATLSLTCGAGCVAAARGAATPSPRDTLPAVLGKAFARAVCAATHAGLGLVGRCATRRADAMLHSAHTASMAEEVRREAGAVTGTEATMVGAPRRRAARAGAVATGNPLPQDPNMPLLELPGPAAADAAAGGVSAQ